MQRKITNIHLRIFMRREIIKEEVPYDLLPAIYKNAYTRFTCFGLRKSFIDVRCWKCALEAAMVMAYMPTN